MDASAGTGGVRSHRGIDLGPTRLHMPSGLLRRVRAAQTDHDIATAPYAVR